MSTYLRRAILAVGLAAFAPFGTASAAAPADTLRYAIDDEQNINRLPQVVAERRGFFAREGLNFQTVSFTSSFRTQAAGQTVPAGAMTVRDGMDRGLADMTRQQLPLLINDANTGRVAGTYVGVTASTTNTIYFLAVRPEVRSYADLRGKTVTLTGLADGITLWLEDLVTQRGVPAGAFTVRSLASSEARLNCMRSGECVAAGLGQPAIFGALDANFRILGMSNEIEPKFYQLDIVKPEWARANRNAVVKYIRAVTAANRYIMDPANREEVVRITTGYMGQPENRTREMLAYIWDPKNRVLPQQAELDMANVRATIALMAKYGQLREPLPAPERFADPSYVEAARQ
jgi:ABC-type nitrate/sulfonate/bicarbonate transport system substrate-binding protein